MASNCKLYQYAPSLPLAVIAVIVFSSLASILCFRTIQTKTFSGLFFAVGAICKCPNMFYGALFLTVISQLVQMAGYTARSFSTLDVCNRTAYGIQLVLLLLGPTLIMFSVNLTQIKFARALGAEKLCFIPIQWQRPLVLSMNGVLLCVQAIGGIMATTTTSVTTIAIGTKIMLAIYVVQFIFWLVIFADNICMTLRLRRHTTESSQYSFSSWKKWNQLFGLSTSIIALGRNILRLTMDGGIAFLVENEWPAYAFDGYQMIIVLGAWAIWYLPEKCESIMDRRDTEAFIQVGPSSSGQSR